MTLNDVERAVIARALDALVKDPAHKHKADLIRRIAGDDAAAQIALLKADFVAANKAAKQGGGSLLSASAADYWREAQATLSYGGMVLANPSPGREKVLSRKCENLLASFDGRVPDSEKGKFRPYIDGDPDNWDDRWHNTRDGFFPLLEVGFKGSVPVPNPLGEAQLRVLASLTEPEGQDRSVIVQRLGGILHRYTEQGRLEEEERQNRERKTRASSAKAEAAQKRKADRAAKIAVGDQKATKALRGRKLKTVPGIVS